MLQLVVLLLLLWVVDGGVGRRLGASGGNMLRAKQIPDFLQQANTAGMRCTLLLQNDGALQGAAGAGVGSIHNQIIGVISSGMWGEFDHSGSRQLQMMLMGMDDGTLGVAKVGETHLVCVYAEAKVDVGTIREKLQNLSIALESALRGLDG